MKVDFFSPIVSRTAAQKEAEKVCRIITSEFPSMSSTIITEFPAVKTDRKYYNFAQEIRRRIEKLVRDPAHRSFRTSGHDELDFYTTFVDAIKKYRVGNCGDRSKLCTLIANMNGIPAQKAEMFTINKGGLLGDPIDHAIQIVPINGQKVEFGPLSKMKNLLIIDPWLGFADFAPKYEQKIKADFHRFFGLADDASVALNPHCYSEPKVTERVANYFREHFPQLIISKEKPLITHKK